MISKMKRWAKQLKSEIVVLYYAYRDERVSPLAKWIALLVVAYAISPIDLIPDFIPVLGFLDDVILLPLGIALVIKLIPKEIMAEHRQRVKEMGEVRLKSNWMMGAFILFIWLFCIIAIGIMIYRMLQ